MIIHPSNDEDPHKECEDVKPSIPDVLHGSMVCGCNEVEDSSLVEDCIDLSDKAENCKSHSHLCDESTSKDNDDQKMMNQEHARLGMEEKEEVSINSVSIWQDSK